MSTKVLTATLPSGSLYVSGTVNGVSTTWTNTSGQTWETVAERAPNDVYVVALTIINSVGVATEAAFTLYYGLHLITDRTRADVAERNKKGNYNASDLNRVGAAMQYVADRLSDFGYAVSVNPKLDWKDGEWPTPGTMKRYLADLFELRSKFAQMQFTPQVPESMERLTYTEANNIEKILESIDMLLTGSAQTWFCSGDLFSGEV